MSYTVWLAARTIDYPKAGGVFWVYLNWALGLKAHSCLRETGYQVACLYGGDAFVLPAANPYCLSRLAMGPDTDLEKALGVSVIKGKMCSRERKY